MDKSEEGFQKRLTLYSVLAAAFYAAVAVLITLGITWSMFDSVPTIDNSQINNSTKDIHTFITSVQESGNKLVSYGVFLLIVSMPIFSFAILKDTSKSKSDNSKSPQIVSLDDMHDKIHSILEEDKNHRSNYSEENPLQKSLYNVQLQLQIAEIKLQISELRNQVTNEKLNKLESKGNRSRSKPRSKKHDTKRKKKSL